VRGAAETDVVMFCEWKIAHGANCLTQKEIRIILYV
jgi:hypothetical protein